MEEELNETFGSYVRARMDDVGPLFDIVSAIERTSEIVAGGIGISPRYEGNNASGDKVSNFDKQANDAFIETLECSCRTLSSEELEVPLTCNEASSFDVAFDPLDGSMNLTSGMSCGSTFIVKRSGSIVVAGYALYAASSILVIASSGEVAMFKLSCWEDPREIPLVRRLVMPRQGNFCCVNEAHAPSWNSRSLIRYVRSAKERGHVFRNDGCMVADCHRVLLHGGLFAYPSNARSPNGKLRLEYEARPLAFVFEAAGGLATTERGARILEVPVDDVHCTTTFVAGSTSNVEECVPT